jgi:hypothetical protein
MSGDKAGPATARWFTYDSRSLPLLLYKLLSCGVFRRPFLSRGAQRLVFARTDVTT